MYVGETRSFEAFLYRGTDSLKCVHTGWYYHGSGGHIGSSGYFYATGPGGGYVIADIGGVKDSAEATIRMGGIGYPLQVSRGWNLISLPANPFSFRPEDLIPRSSGYLFEYDPLTRAYVEPEMLEIGKAYFYLCFRDTIYNIIGEELDSVTKGIHRGWNLIGGLTHPVSLSDFYFSPSGLLLMPPVTWDGAYVELDTLRPGRGCWVLSNSDGEITITNR
jgi:hypothetical protein